MNYNEQLDVIKQYKVRSGEHRRFDCPFCRGRNTLSITNASGKLIWYCFKNSCEARGSYYRGLRLNEIVSKLDEPVLDISRRPNQQPIPEFLSAVDYHPDIMEWLGKVNSLEAYYNGRVDIRYSPVDNRVMFAVRDGNRIVGYIGRRLEDIVDPRAKVKYIAKWKKFGDCSHVFKCGEGKIGVIVEDCPSACAVSALTGHVGLSILGTTLTELHKTELRAFDSLYVALDPDASSKGLSLTRRIVNSQLKIIPNDLKNYQPEEIHTILYGETKKEI